MKVIDEILNEWSFRCHDGIVDLNDPIKVSILNEILKEYSINLNEDEDNDQKIEDRLLNMLSTANKEEKKRILTFFNKKNDQDIEDLEDKIKIDVKKDKSVSEEEIDKVERYLEQKGLPVKETLFLVRVFTRKKEGKQLVDYFNTKHNFDISNPSIFQATKDLDPEAVSLVYNSMASIAGRKAIGKEEYFILAFYDNVSKKSKGDLIISNKHYEIKGQNAIMAAVSGNPKNQLPLFAKKVGVDYNIVEGNIWVNRLKAIYNNIDKNKENEFKIQLNTFLNSIYKTTFNLDKVIVDNQFNSEILSKEIIKYLIDKNKTEDSYIFVSGKGDLKIIENKETLKNAVDNNEIKITAFSDAVPRLSYTEENNLFDKNVIKKISQPSLNKIDILKPNYKSLISGTTKLQFASDTWIKSHPEYAKFFDDTKRHPLDKNYFQLKPDSKIELTPTE